MQNASQSDPGFHEQQGRAPILQRAREAAPHLAAGGLITIGVVCLCMVGWAKYIDHQAAQLQQDIAAQQAQTEASAFAADQLLQCKQKPAFHTLINPSADCSSRVAEAAQNLKGDQVAGEVTRHLSTLLDRSTMLHALRLEERHIANFVAKYGFRIAGLVGDFAFQDRPR